MIAVFKSEGVKYTTLLPAKEFKVIRKVEDIAGRKFTGVLLAPGWADESMSDRIQAFEVLRTRQPELFNNHVKL